MDAILFSEFERYRISEIDKAGVVEDSFLRRAIKTNSFDDQLLERGAQLRIAIQQHDTFIESQPMTPADSSFGVEQSFNATACDFLNPSELETRGIEHDSVRLANRLFEASGSEFSDVTQKSSDFVHTANHLERITQTWPSLPPHIQEAILTNVPSECLQIWNTKAFDIDDWNIESQESREPEFDLLTHTPELGDFADAKNH